MKKFNLLVLSEACRSNPPVTAGQSYVDQLTRRLAREGLRLAVDCYSPLSLADITGLLPRLSLQQYDLIVLQPGHIDLQRPAAVSDPASTGLNRMTITMGVPGNGLRQLYGLKPLRDAVRLAGLRLLAALGVNYRLKQTRLELRTVLDGLQPCGHNVVLITPFPHQDPVSNWLRQQGRRVFLEEGYRAFMPVFDAYALLDVGDICFVPGRASTLNALGNELVGSALYDFFRAGVRVVGDSSSYRRHE